MICYRAERQGWGGVGQAGPFQAADVGDPQKLDSDGAGRLGSREFCAALKKLVRFFCLAFRSLLCMRCLVPGACLLQLRVRISVRGLFF